MNTYFYQAPLVKSSTQKCEILSEDEKNEVIGSVQRYFSSVLHRIIDSIIGRNNLIVKVKAMDTENKTIIKARTEMAMVKRPNYYINFVGGTWKDVKFQAIQTNNQMITPEFSIKGYGIEITTKKDIFDWVKFYEEGQEVARWRSRAKEKFTTYIEIEKNASVLDPLFYSVLGQLLYFISY